MSRRRIYFLVPTVPSARAIFDELLLARVEARHVHIIAREGTPLEGLPEASPLQQSDLIPALEKGVAAGGVTGLLAGALAVTYPPAGLVLGAGAILGLTAFGAGFGAWMAGMVGIGLPSGRLKKFEDAIAAGQLLMMIDVPRERVEEVEAIVLRHHAEADLEGVEARMPIFP